VLEVDPARRDLCSRLGAISINPSIAPVPDQVRDIFGSAADSAIDAVGNSASMNDALNSIAFGGVVTLVGMASPELNLPSYRISTEEREMVGSFCYSNGDFSHAASWVNSGPPVLSALISRAVGLEQANDAFCQLAAGDGTAGKVVVHVQDDLGLNFGGE